MIGRTISHYRILDKLGEGGMGAVYRGMDTMLDRSVAVKVLHGHISRQPDVISRFRTEAALLAKLNDPNIATLYSFFREGDDFFMVMEFVDGQTLAHKMRSGPQLTPQQVVALTAKTLSGLEHAHSLGILHRDIKPANILVTSQRQVKITDFGISRVLGSERLTRDLRVVGTPEYLAPERIRGEEGDLRSDLYSVGIVLYELLSGRLPFERNSDFELMRAHLEDQPTPVALGSGHRISPELEAVVLRALAKNPADRFQTAGEMREALLAIDTQPAALPATRFVDLPEALPQTRFADPLPAVAPPASSKHSKPLLWWAIGGASALALVLLFVLVHVAGDHFSAPPSTSPQAVATPTPAQVPAAASVQAAPPLQDNSATNAPNVISNDDQVKRQQRARRRAAALKALDQ